MIDILDKNKINKTRFGFTLAEVLITLGVIGVIAAMTIPTIRAKITERRTVTQLRATQSILAQALRSLEEKYGTAEGWGLTDYDEAGAIKIADNLKTVMKIALDCGVDDNNGHCAPNETYKFLNGRNNVNFATDRRMYKIVLLNGTSLYIRSAFDGSGSVAVFYVDTNGKAKPNTWGRDLFQFILREDGLTPSGHPLKSSTTTAQSCNKSGKGFGCSYYVLHHGNMNYLH